MDSEHTHLSICFGIVLIMISFPTDQVDATDQECSHRCSECRGSSCIECYYGYWGGNCKYDCENCWLAGCKKQSGECIQCKPGRYGRYCDMHCSVNCRMSRFEDVAYCNRHTGKCLEGCMEGWWGSTCNRKCNPGCQKACYQKDGACISDCKKGFYGMYCKKSCSEGCAAETCDWLTGTCHEGCKCGYTGDTCEDVCSNNCSSPCIYNEKMKCLKCNVTCGMNCKDCDQRTGECLQCSTDWCGTECNHPCNDNTSSEKHHAAKNNESKDSETTASPHTNGKSDVYHLDSTHVMVMHVALVWCHLD